MSLELDEQQQARHTFRTMISQCGILRSELVNAGFYGGMADQMVLSWWDSLIQASMAPDFKNLLKDFLPQDDD